MYRGRSDGRLNGASARTAAADRSAGRLTGSMMELQTLQEALKVEIQIHQKLVAQMKQDPQKKVVEQLRKELLVKQEPEAKLQLQVQAPPAAAATPALPGSVLPQRPPTVAMVTTAITKADSQNAPINLQVASKLTNQSSEPVRLVSKNAMVVQATTSTTNTSTSVQPIKVPQFVPPPRLTPRPTFQPQLLLVFLAVGVF
ncbi:hypothetical protein INR49_010144 [Caranx melampygus]|nr:hypothetical protein INR49_010144 [Caranx melampygus]